MVPTRQFSCLYGLSLQRFHNSQPSTFVCDHHWLVISNFFLSSQRERYYFPTLDLHAKQAWGQLRKTPPYSTSSIFCFSFHRRSLFYSSEWQLNTLKYASGLPFCSIYIPYVFIGSSSWIDFTNPEIRNWWASKFALSEYQVIWKFLCFFNGTITSPTPSLVKNRHH